MLIPGVGYGRGGACSPPSAPLGDSAVGALVPDGHAYRLVGPGDQVESDVAPGGRRGSWGHMSCADRRLGEQGGGLGVLLSLGRRRGGWGAGERVRYRMAWCCRCRVGTRARRFRGPGAAAAVHPVYTGFGFGSVELFGQWSERVGAIRSGRGQRFRQLNY